MVNYVVNVEMNGKKLDRARLIIPPVAIGFISIEVERYSRGDATVLVEEVAVNYNAETGMRSVLYKSGNVEWFALERVLSHPVQVTQYVSDLFGVGASVAPESNTNKMNAFSFEDMEKMQMSDGRVPDYTWDGVNIESVDIKPFIEEVGHSEKPNSFLEMLGSLKDDGQHELIMKPEHAVVRTKLSSYVGVYVKRDGQVVLLYVISKDADSNQMIKLFEEQFNKEVLSYDGFTLRELKFPTEVEQGPGSIDGWDITNGGSITIDNGCLLERNFLDNREMKVVVEAVTKKLKEGLIRVYRDLTKFKL